jgi:polyisoprenoid-binding protein YceI
MTTTIERTNLTGTYVIDPSHSTIGFVARHAMVTKVRGAFNEFEGSIEINGDDPAASSAHVTIQAASIDTRNADRDAHLRSNDFFAMEEYPTISFASTAVDVDGDSVSLTGDLTIKAVTKSVTIDFELTGSATDPFGNDRLGFEGELEINRKDWGVEWNAPLETGGVLVGEKVKLSFDVSAIRQA